MEWLEFRDGGCIFLDGRIIPQLHWYIQVCHRRHAKTLPSNDSRTCAFYYVFVSLCEVCVQVCSYVFSVCKFVCVCVRLCLYVCLSVCVFLSLIETPDLKPNQYFYIERIAVSKTFLVSREGFHLYSLYSTSCTYFKRKHKDPRLEPFRLRSVFFATEANIF